MIAFIFGIAIIILYTFTNGLKDGTNAIATVLGSRSMSPRAAIITAAVLELVSPFAAYLTAFKVSGTVQSIVNTGADFFALSGMRLVICAMLSAALWNAAMIKLKMPSSSTHSMVGALCGAAIAAGGTAAVNWQALLLSVVLFMFLTPMIGFAAGFLCMKVVDGLTRSSHAHINKFFKRAQVFNLVFLSFNHSFNDSQKSIGIMMMLYGAFVGWAVSPPVWMALSVGAALCAGVVFSGYGVVKTVGGGIYRLRPKHAFSAQIASSAVIFTSSLLGAPVSSGQIVVSSITGVGSSDRANAVRWFAVKNIALSWLFTLPSSAAISAAVYYLSLLIF